MAYEPALYLVPGRSNVPGEHTYKVQVTYASNDPGSAKGKYVGLSNTATGKLTFTLPRSYRRLTGFRWGWTTLAAGAVYFPVILSHTVTTDGAIIVETRTEAGTATDPASGSVLVLEFDVTNDSLDDEGSITIT